MALVRCRTGFIRGEEYVGTGEIFEDSHPLVTSTPAEWWEPLKVRGAPVEEATTTPGKKRATKAAPA